MHRSRRQATRDRLSEVSAGSVVFVCEGNLCRSPFAEALFRRLVEGLRAPGIVVQSAGFAQPGRMPPKEALAAARTFGVDLAPHRSRLVTGDLLKRASLVPVMTPAQARWIRQRFGTRIGPVLLLGDLDPLPIQRREITDPWGQEYEVFEACYARIDRCVQALAGIVTSSSSYASPSR